MASISSGRIKAFNFEPGFALSEKYTVVRSLGAGWEGEVFIVRENLTGIERAAKFFYPHRNVRNKTLRFYAKKLHKLRNCPILIQYLTQESIDFQGQKVHSLISEYVDGETLDEFLRHQRGKRLGAFQALHLLYALVSGLEQIHTQRDYHGDLHEGNIIVHRYGLGFDLKLIDTFHWGAARPENLRSDICDAVRVFYNVLGGQKTYASHHPVVKEICCGLKQSLILKKFKTATHLKKHLEYLAWD
jgi:serine/threonine protein kinase